MSQDGEVTKALEDDEIRGRILGRNRDKSRKSFPPRYLQSLLLTDFTFYSLEQKWFETGL